MASLKYRKNINFERSRNNCRNLLEGEAAETYIMELCTLAESCEFKDTNNLQQTAGRNQGQFTLRTYANLVESGCNPRHRGI